MPPIGIDSEVLANNMFSNLVGAGNANMPDVDIWGPSHNVPWDPTSPVFQPVERVTVAELLDCTQQLQDFYKGVLEDQYDRQRITGGDYAKTFVALSQSAMQGAVQFMLGKDQSFWMAVKTQADAITARMQNEKLKMEVMVLRAQFANLKEELIQKEATFSLTLEQRIMTHEQMESQRAQTINHRLDGENRVYFHINKDGTSEQRLTGLLGTQRALYEQQIYSYRDDAKTKAAKILSDSFMTMKTLDPGIGTPKWTRPPVFDSNGTETQSTPLDGMFHEIRTMAIGKNDGYTP